jgi:hypothetical protein
MVARAVVVVPGAVRTRIARVRATGLGGLLPERSQGQLQLLTHCLGLVGDLQALVEHGHRVLRVARKP